MSKTNFGKTKKAGDFLAQEEKYLSAIKRLVAKLKEDIQEFYEFRSDQFSETEFIR